MPHRYKASTGLTPFAKLKLCHALQKRLKEGYTAGDLRSDLMAGVIVGMVAIPLGMALAIASGVAPQNGLYTVIIGGAIVALLGGSQCQVTGPTAAFVVILAPITHQYGLGGLMMAGFMAGCLLLIMGLARLGRLIEYIPYPVTTGFTTGIAVVIAVIQLKDFLGLTVYHMPEKFFGRIFALFEARHSFSIVEFGIGVVTLAILILWPKINKKIPSPLIALSAVTLASVVLKHFFPELHFSTIGTRFHTEINGQIVPGIPATLPAFAWPWSGLGGHDFLSTLDLIEKLIPSAFAIAMLGAIESLLSAVVADGMAHTKHDPDAELVALGMGNILCPFFGGIAATGAIARTATNIRFGARSPIASIIHALFSLLVVLLFAPYVSYLPMAALAALLLIVAYNMSESKHFLHIIRVSPGSDVLVLLLCCGLTIVFDMVVGVTLGVMLAAILFMKRMATLTKGRVLFGEGVQRMAPGVPDSVMVYEIAGPLFFGAANRAIEALGEISYTVRCVVFDMEEVPVMDATGLVALESALRRLSTRKTHAILAGAQAQPLELLMKAHVLKNYPNTKMAPSMQEALQTAKELVGK